MSARTFWSRRQFVQLISSSSAFGSVRALAPWLPGAGSEKTPATVKRATPRFAYIGCLGKTQGIYVFSIHGERWTLRQVIASNRPLSLALHPNQQFLYAVNAIDTYRSLPAGTIEAYSIDPQKGILTLLNRQPLSLSGIMPKHLAISPDGRNVVVAIHGGGAYNVLPIRADGHLERVSGIVKETGSGPDRQWQEAAHPHTVIFDTTGRYVLSSDLGSDRLNVFSWTDGKLILRHRSTTTSGSGPAHLAMHPSGHLLYVLNKLDASIACYGYDAANGRMLERLHHVPTFSSNSQEQASADILVIHPSGRFLYASGYGKTNSVAMWSIDTSSGALTPIQHMVDGLHFPSAMTIVPDGTSLFAMDKSSIVRMFVDPISGHLNQPVKMAEVPTPMSLAMKYL